MAKETLSSVLAALDKDFDGVRKIVTGPKKAIQVISTGSITLDRATGVGGIPRGRLIQIEGWESAGKTTLVLSTIKSAQKMGLRVLFLDYEGTFDEAYAERCGIDMSEDKFYIFQPLFMEQGDAIMLKLMDIGAVDLVVIDSVAAMKPRQMVTGDAESSDMLSILEQEKTQIGLHSRKMGDWADRMSKWCRELNVTFLLINQYRTNIKTNPYARGGDAKATGGTALPFYLSMRISLTQTSKEFGKEYNPLTGKEDKVPVASTIRAAIEKNKVGSPFRTCEFSIRYGEGVDNIRTVMDIAKAKGIMKTGGPYWSFGQEGEPLHFKAQGIDNCRQYLVENPATFEAIESMCLADVG